MKNKIVKRSQILGRAALWVGVASLITTSANAFTYATTLPAAPTGFLWSATDTGTFFGLTDSANLSEVNLASGIINPTQSYEQANSITGQTYSHVINPLSVTDEPDRFFLITSQTILTTVTYQTTDVFTSFDFVNSNGFGVLRSAEISFDGGGDVAYSATNDFTDTQVLFVETLEARTLRRFFSATSSALFTGGDIDLGVINLNGTVDFTQAMQTSVTDGSNGVVVGSSFDDFSVFSRNNLNYTEFRLVPIPEPSTALLGALGILATLRRRRS